MPPARVGEHQSRKLPATVRQRDRTPRPLGTAPAPDPLRGVEDACLFWCSTENSVLHPWGRWNIERRHAGLGGAEDSERGWLDRDGPTGSAAAARMSAAIPCQSVQGSQRLTWCGCPGCDGHRRGQAAAAGPQSQAGGVDVPALGLEPRCPCGRGILSPLRLPFRQAGVERQSTKNRVGRACPRPTGSRLG